MRWNGVVPPNVEGRPWTRWLVACAVALALLTATGCRSRTALAPAPTLYADLAEDPFARVPQALCTTHADVLYATDRLPEATDGAGNVSYGCERASALTLGLCRVEFGEGPDWAALVAASRASKRPHPVELGFSRTQPFAKFAETGIPPRVNVDGNPEPDPAAEEEDRRARDALWRALRGLLAETGRKEVFLFVHGYDNTLEDGALRIAQVWHFLGREGVPVVYSWPAGYGSILHGYTHDRESGEFTIFHLKQFLCAVADSPEVSKVHLIAHSRGTDVLMTALREIHLATRGNYLDTRRRLKIGNVVLVAPDLDVQVAAQRIAAEGLGSVPERTTVYMNAEDRAIDLAAWLFGSVLRLGQVTLADMTPEQRKAYEALKEVNFIEVDVKTDFWGHSYFTANPSVLSDLILVLRDSRAPGAENGRPLVYAGGGIWELEEGYPRSPREP